MPIPFIIAGVAAAAGLYGAKKGVDAVIDHKDAKKINSSAEAQYENAKKELNGVREQGQELWNRLGKHKLQALEYVKQCEDLLDEIDPEIANRIKDQTNKIQITNSFTMSHLVDLHKEVDLLFNVASGLGQGALAGLAAGGGSFLGVTTLGAASTGTAISSLSGAAATNATLAWFGGGSIASGGLGMAGGTAILGGIVAGPVLAIGGIVLAAKAAQAKAKAEENLEKVKIAIADMSLAQLKVEDIIKYGNQIDYLLLGLVDLWTEKFKLLDLFIDLVEIQKKHSNFSESEEYMMFHNHLFATTVYNIIDQAIIDENGAITTKAQELSKEDYTQIAQNIMDEKLS